MENMNPKASILVVGLVIAGCATSSPIKKLDESKSKFSNPPELMAHSYPEKDIYRIYHRASTGFVPISSIRREAEQRAEEFAHRQGKSFVVLGERISQPPYILGNFPRIEIVFALVERKDAPQSTNQSDRYADLERLKKLFDSGVLTQKEFETEKARILKQ